MTEHPTYKPTSPPYGLVTDKRLREAAGFPRSDIPPSYHHRVATRLHSAFLGDPWSACRVSHLAKTWQCSLPDAKRTLAMQPELAERLAQLRAVRWYRGNPNADHLAQMADMSIANHIRLIRPIELWRLHQQMRVTPHLNMPLDWAALLGDVVQAARERDMTTQLVKRDLLLPDYELVCAMLALHHVTDEALFALIKLERVLHYDSHANARKFTVLPASVRPSHVQTLLTAAQNRRANASVVAPSVEAAFGLDLAEHRDRYRFTFAKLLSP